MTDKEIEAHQQKANHLTEQCSDEQPESGIQNGIVELARAVGARRKKSEEKRQEDKHKVKTSEPLNKYFAIVSFVLGLFSFMMMLYYWIDFLFDVPHQLHRVLQFLYLEDTVLHSIAAILLLLSLPSAFLALVIGFFTYYKTDRKDSPKGKKLALWSIILSLFYWILFFIRHTVGLPGYRWQFTP